jgi:DNA topoisomerase-1
VPEPLRIIAGDCTVTYTNTDETRTQRGKVVTLCKPDDTVLVHDAAGYQPAAWLTRPAELTLNEDPLWLVAVDGNESLHVEAEADVTVTDHATSAAGLPVGDCSCGGRLVRASGTVACLACDADYPLPSGATVLEVACDDCGLPRIRVERGEPFEVCLDYDCESLLSAVEARFDREWSCPECGGALDVLRRGGLIAGCENYPECETGFAIPDGTVVDDCDCNLPVFETASGRRCLDSNCEV